MTSRRAIKGVLQNFLGTFTSRYSDLDGYWLFGSLMEGVEHLRMDLMHQNSDSNKNTPLAVAQRLAETKFEEQIEKAGVSKSCLREAFLDITKSPGSKMGNVNGHLCPGHDVIFVASALTDLGQVYESKLVIFIAPHDANIELRSARAR